MMKWNSDLADFIRDFVLECSTLPDPESSGQEGQAEWKVENGDDVQDLCREALFPECNGATMC